MIIWFRCLGFYLSGLIIMVISVDRYIIIIFIIIIIIIKGTVNDFVKISVDSAVLVDTYIKFLCKIALYEGCAQG